jgi:hypothetical protein
MNKLVPITGHVPALIRAAGDRPQQARAVMATAFAAAIRRPEIILQSSPRPRRPWFQPIPANPRAGPAQNSHQYTVPWFFH